MLAPPKWVGIRPNGAFLRCPYPVAPSALFRAHRACPHCGQMWVQFIPLLPFALQSTLLGRPCPGHLSDIWLPNLDRLGAGNLPRGWANLPSLLVSPPVLPFGFQGRNNSLSHLPTKVPTPHFTPLEVYGCHPTRERGAKAPTGADRGFTI